MSKDRRDPETNRGVKTLVARSLRNEMSENHRMHKEFQDEVRENIAGLGADKDFQQQSLEWNLASAKHRYTYNFRALGRPIIQFPQDILAFQEIIWDVRPDLIIETGIAHGGSLISNASMLALLDYCDAFENGERLDPRVPKRKVLAVDIEIRPHNRSAIEAHAMSPRIHMLEGSSIDTSIVDQVRAFAADYNSIMVCLDSNHTHDHVLRELEAYAPLVTVGNYCIVSDTIVEDAPEHLSADRPWGKGNNPKTAVHAYLAQNGDFEIDKSIENKLQITVSPDGFLRRIK